MSSGDGEHRGGQGPATGSAQRQREARLRTALRANLARRKAQALALRAPQAPPHGIPDANQDD